MTKKPLSLPEMHELERILSDLFLHIWSIKTVYPLAEHIQYPKIPWILAQSAVLHLHKALFEGSTEATFGGRECDILVSYPNGERRKAEVKGTGESAFEEFVQKDIEADFLVWVHFGEYFQGRGGVTIYCLPEPNRIYKQRKKIALSRFLADASPFGLKALKGGSLSEIVGEHSSSQ